MIESFNTRLARSSAEALDALAFLDLQGTAWPNTWSDRVKSQRQPPPFTTTHAEIAADLYTSRVVVVSQHPEAMLEREGNIELHRNRIEVLNF